jgi:mono/diheme cytochrome c family protein
MRVAFAALACCVLIGCGRPEEPVAEGEVTDFPLLFQQNCSGCHGADGKYGPSRNLHDREYLSLIPKDTLRSTVENGRPGTAMPAFAEANGGSLSEIQITALVNGIESQWAGKPVTFAGLTPPDYVNGKKLFMRACFMCHYPGGKVGAVTGPLYLNLVSDQWLRSSIIAGRSDLGMPDWRVLNAGKPLADGDVNDLVTYLTSQRATKQ